jgi:CheY-like chemotaxis protein
MIKILLVEDEFLIARLLQRNLKLLGYEMVELVSSGEEALERVKEEKPDVIVMDIRLAGELNGIEAAKEIRQFCATPIIFLSGYSDRETIARANQVEPLAFLIKPISPDDITAVIEIALSKN